MEEQRKRGQKRGQKKKKKGSRQEGMEKKKKNYLEERAQNCQRTTDKEMNTEREHAVS